MRGIKSNLTGVVDETTNRGMAMMQLIQKYLAIRTEFGLRNLGDYPELTLPVLFVEPAPGYEPQLVTLGKYEIVLTFNLYWYVADSNPSDVVSLCASVGHNLEKLFSNNALNDLGTVNPPSHNFCAYEPNWTEVESFSFKCLPTFKNPLANQAGEFMRLGRGTVKIRTWIIR